jgi:YggT family protein
VKSACKFVARTSRKACPDLPARLSPRKRAYSWQPFLDVVLIVLQLYVYVIIASAILSWLVAFNVVNRYNDFVRSIWNLVTALTEPLLKPIRGVIPNFGGIDISPVILLLLIFFIQRVIEEYIYPNVF